MGDRSDKRKKKKSERQDISDKFRKYTGRQVSYFTHGIHRYPAKFIPQVPRFCIDRYSEPGDVVIDPFMGSGTTLLEALLMGRDSYGIDILPLAKLITKVKITPMNFKELKSTAEKLITVIAADEEENDEYIPEIANFDHWFRKDVAGKLATIKKHIWMLPDGDEKDFFKICFSSIIRKLSNSDNDSLIPEVTTFQKKLVEQKKVDFNAITRFENAVRLKLIEVQDFGKALSKSKKKYNRESKATVIGNDAKDISLEDGSVDLGITSPPYASAVHYVSVHKLEMHWLDMMDIDPDLDSKIVGSVKAYAHEYNNWEPGGTHPEVDDLVEKLAKEDRKSGYIIHKYFIDMKQNLEEMYRVLTRNGVYCMVAGENMLKKNRIPTYKMIDILAQQVGYERNLIYEYDIINRHLDVPRWNNSAILKDHILVFGK